MANQNDRTVFSWLRPEVLLGLPGDFIVGFFLAAGGMAEPELSIYTVFAGLIWLICVAALGMSLRRNDKFPVFAGLYRISAVVFGCCFAPFGPMLWAVAAAAVLLGIYGYGCSRIVSLGQGDEPVMLGRRLAWVLLSSVAFCAGALAIGFWNHGLSLNLLLVVWFIAWMLSRTIYFSVALKGYNSPERLRQGGGLFLRGIILLQGAAVVAILSGNHSLATAIAAFVVVTAQTFACRVIP